jgi:hypothetical protein
MSTYRNWKTNKSKESTGITIDLPTGEKFVVKRLGGSNYAYGKKLQELSKPFRREIAGESLSPSIAEGFLVDSFCETSLVSWDNVTDENEQPLAFNDTNAKKLFRDCPDLFAEVTKQAADFKNYLDISREGDQKNLSSI